MRLLKLLVLSTIAFAGAANGQSTEETGSVAIDGSVAGLCMLGPPSRSSIDLGILIAMSGSRVGRLRAISAEQVTLPGSFCNFAGTVVGVSADALVANDSADVETGFARAVNYTSTVSNWTTEAAMATTEASAGGQGATASGWGAFQPDPKIADLRLTLSAFGAPGDGLLVAGDYEGTVTITLGPAAAN